MASKQSEMNFKARWRLTAYISIFHLKILSVPLHIPNSQFSLVSQSFVHQCPNCQHHWLGHLPKTHSDYAQAKTSSSSLFPPEESPAHKAGCKVPPGTWCPSLTLTPWMGHPFPFRTLFLPRPRAYFPSLQNAFHS